MTKQQAKICRLINKHTKINIIEKKTKLDEYDIQHLFADTNPLWYSDDGDEVCMSTKLQEEYEGFVDGHRATLRNRLTLIFSIFATLASAGSDSYFWTFIANVFGL